VEHASEFSRRFDRRLAEQLRRAGRDDPASSYITWAVESQSEPIHHLDRSLFALPPETPEFVGDEPTRVLQDLLYEVWEVNERFAGQPQVEAFVQINGSPEQHDIIERSLGWARDVVDRRLQRLWGELVPFIDQLGIVEASQGKTKMANGGLPRGN
jgi:hypothetical protein